MTARSCGSPTRGGSGTAVVLSGDELGAYLDARLGVEPLGGELTAEALARLAAGRTAPLKSFLLDQRGVAGIGNIYADEALWRAELHPLSPAGSMRAEHCEALVEGIVEALEAGLANGGSSIDDYRDARGEMGLDAGRVPGPHARGPGVPALRRRDPADRRRRALDLLLPGLPGPAAPPPEARAASDERAARAARGLSDRALERSRGADRLHGRDRAGGDARRGGRARRRAGDARDGRDRARWRAPIG